MPAMRIRQLARIAAVTSVLVTALAGCAAFVPGGVEPRAHQQPVRPDPLMRTLSISCRSPAMGGRVAAQVYLPPDYNSHGHLYRVVYFLHGLPAGPQSYTQNAFAAQALASVHQAAIVVAPQGARNVGDDREYLDWSSTEDWPRAIGHDLTACIDHRFHTIAQRTGRALIGVSAGGYGAMNIGLRNLRTFAVIEAWSGYFVATDPSGTHVLKLPSPKAQQGAAVPDGAWLAGQLSRWPALVAFYVGRSDQRFLSMNQAFDAALRTHHIAHVFRTYPGGHTASLWRSRAAAWLSMALNFLATGHSALQSAATG
jgi:enterochelin esterase-like enzyme